MAKIMDVNEVELAAWLETRPRIIRDMAAKCPPGRLYRMASTGQRVLIQAYSEDRTVRVAVTKEYNFVSHERSVFGIPLEDLTECDLPGPDEPTGAVLDNAELEAALARGHDGPSRMAEVEKATLAKIAGSRKSDE